ncbi:MAG: hypothetical protein M1828_003191 [Chrysothrix sp. TS-e1954]|nr:MAG: hypothetical protein M1828_003191 [Chrysothrix sp. TS-e1954]
MTSILRRVVAGPRAPHAEANLDLCYVTDNIIATSGPSSTYPSRAYRNPLDQLVRFLDSKHGADWAIWEFRAEGTGYPDSEVYGRIWHYPWPDHHPPPFKLVPGILGSMREWMKGESALDEQGKRKQRVVVVHCKAGKGRSGSMAVSYLLAEEGWAKNEALERFTARRMRPGFGAGVSIPSQLRWIDYVERWARNGKIYVEQAVEVVELHIWGLRDGVKLAIEGYIEEGRVIKTFHVFSKDERDDVNDRGKISEQGGSLADVVSEVVRRGKSKSNSRSGSASRSRNRSSSQNAHASASPVRSAGPTRRAGRSTTSTSSDTQSSTTLSPHSAAAPALPSAPGAYIDGTPSDSPSSLHPPSLPPSEPSTTPNTTIQDEPPTSTKNVIFRPSKRILLPTNDVNLSVEKRSKGGYGWSMPTSVAHIWFNCFFEGNGPETMNPGTSPRVSKPRDTNSNSNSNSNSSSSSDPTPPGNTTTTTNKRTSPRPDASGVFTTPWTNMDGLKGSSRKGTRAFDKAALVWKIVDSPSDLAPSASPFPRSPATGSPARSPTRSSTATATRPGSEEQQQQSATPSAPHRNSIIIPEPSPGEPISSAKAADWRGKTPVKDTPTPKPVSTPVSMSNQAGSLEEEGAEPHAAHEDAGGMKEAVRKVMRTETSSHEGEAEAEAEAEAEGEAEGEGEGERVAEAARAGAGAGVRSARPNPEDSENEDEGIRRGVVDSHVHVDEGV